MSQFDPKKQITNCYDILKNDGSLPSFYESHVIALNYKRGNFIQEIDGFDEPTIEASIEMTYEEPPYVLDINFYQCTAIEMSYFNFDNTIERLTFSTEQRGFFADGLTPLPPYICVEIGTKEYTLFTSFKCCNIEVVGKREIIGASYI
jgi:hypothetical protein